MTPKLILSVVFNVLVYISFTFYKEHDTTWTLPVCGRATSTVSPLPLFGRYLKLR